MNTSKSIAGFFVLALAAGTVSGAAQAQSDQDHSAHHPGMTQTHTAPAQAPGPPMRGGDGQGGMMGGDMQPVMGMMHLDHIEGRIAFLKAELGITDAQKPQWDAFADALRAQADKLKLERAQMMRQRAPKNWPDLLGREQHTLLMRVEILNEIEGSARAFYAALSPDQQKKANELMPHAVGGR